MSQLQPHEARVVKERVELADKVDKLRQFVNSEQFNTLESLDRTLLADQLQTMDQYLNILQRRSVNYVVSDTKVPDITSLELAAAGKSGRRITREEIEALMAKVTYVVVVPEGTTSTFCHAYLGTFLLDSGFSACVDPANFIAATGERIARADAAGKAVSALWKLEGYALFREINHGAA